MGYIYNKSEWVWIIGTNLIALYVNAKNVTFFDSVGVDYIPKEIIKFIANKNIITHIYRIQTNNSIIHVKSQKFIRVYKFISS